MAYSPPPVPPTNPPDDPSIYEDIEIRENIASHLSSLNNLRLIKILESMDIAKTECWKHPIVDNVQVYFAYVYTFFDDVFMLFKKEEIHAFQNMFGDYWSLYWDLVADPKMGTVANVYRLLHYVDEINRYCKACIQRFQYLFRIRSLDPSTIKDSTTLLKMGGGIFGTPKRKHGSAAGEAAARTCAPAIATINTGTAGSGTAAGIAERSSELSGKGGPATTDKAPLPADAGSVPPKVPDG